METSLYCMCPKNWGKIFERVLVRWSLLVIEIDVIREIVRLVGLVQTCKHWNQVYDSHITWGGNWSLSMHVFIFQ